MVRVTAGPTNGEQAGCGKGGGRCVCTGPLTSYLPRETGTRYSFCLRFPSPRSCPSPSLFLSFGFPAAGAGFGSCTRGSACGADCCAAGAGGATCIGVATLGCADCCGGGGVAGGRGGIFGGTTPLCSAPPFPGAGLAAARGVARAVVPFPVVRPFRDAPLVVLPVRVAAWLATVHPGYSTLPGRCGHRIFRVRYRPGQWMRPAGEALSAALSVRG